MFPHAPGPIIGLDILCFSFTSSLINRRCLAIHIFLPACQVSGLITCSLLSLCCGVMCVALFHSLPRAHCHRYCVPTDLLSQLVSSLCVQIPVGFLRHPPSLGLCGLVSGLLTLSLRVASYLAGFISFAAVVFYPRWRYPPICVVEDFTSTLTVQGSTRLLFRIFSVQ